MFDISYSSCQLTNNEFIFLFYLSDFDFVYATIIVLYSIKQEDIAIEQSSSLNAITCYLNIPSFGLGHGCHV
jgi:hypothetical protein